MGTDIDMSAEPEYERSSMAYLSRLVEEIEDWRAGRTIIELASFGFKGVSRGRHTMTPIIQLLDQGEAIPTPRVFGVDFSKEDLSGATIEDLRLSRCSFVGTSLEGAALKGVTMDRCDFDGVNMNNIFVGSSSKTSSTIKDCIFKGASLNGARIIRSALITNDFTQAALDHSQFGSFGQHVDESGSIVVSNCNFAGASLTFAKLRIDVTKLNRFFSTDLTGSHISITYKGAYNYLEVDDITDFWDARVEGSIIKGVSASVFEPAHGSPLRHQKQ